MDRLIRRHDTQRLKGGEHRRALHRAAAIGLAYFALLSSNVPLCDEEQGFLLDKPLTAEAFDTLLHVRTTAARP